MISISFQKEQAILQLYSEEVITHIFNNSKENSDEIDQKETWSLKRVAKVNMQ